MGVEAFAALGTVHDHVGDVPTAFVDHLDRWPVGRSVLVSPLAHGRKHRPQVPALGGEAVFVARRMVAVADFPQHIVLKQVGEALVEYVPGDPEALMEVVEAGDAEEGVADDQHRPPLADHLQALGYRAVHAGEALAFHDTTLEGCIIELKILRLVL